VVGNGFGLGRVLRCTPTPRVRLCYGTPPGARLYLHPGEVGPMTEKRSANAIRQDRYRRHRRGDHSTCLEGRCDAVTPPPAEDTPTAAPGLETGNEAAETTLPGETFGPSGKAIWDGTLRFGTLTVTQRALLREVCRMSDRADDLNEAIKEHRDDLGTVKWLMREARQLAIAMKGLVLELRNSGAAGGSGQADPDDGREHLGNDPDTPVGEGGPGIADITARIAERLSQAAG
jgi:hypothetical protein